jgi:hypothetical protein
MADTSFAFKAPWGRTLKVVSAVGTLFLTGIAALEAAVIPRDLLGGWPWAVATFLPLLILAASMLFVVRGYSLSPNLLQVQRLLWRTQIPLESLHRAWASPDATAGSFRLFGNGGLYSFTGIFRNKRLGAYRSFVTDSRRAVVLELAGRTLVVTPESPDELLAQLQLICPTAEVARIQGG